VFVVVICVLIASVGTLAEEDGDERAMEPGLLSKEVVIIYEYG
jgi:hypothetical protein